jgi:hypothetical protein
MPRQRLAELEEDEPELARELVERLRMGFLHRWMGRRYDEPLAFVARRGLTAAEGMLP